MKHIWLALLVTNAPLAAFATEGAITISSNAAFTQPEAVTADIKQKCDLPAHQANAVRRALQEQGIEVTTSEKDDVPQSGKFLQLRILSAVSMGNAFTGHKKQVHTQATLYENGKEITKYSNSRNSMGGAFGGFKGSCDVLQRCADTLGKDIAGWFKRRLADGAPSPVNDTPSDDDAAGKPEKK